MISRLTLLSLAILLVITFTSCRNSNPQSKSTNQSSTKKVATDSFFNQVTKLAEFKLEEKRVDSIKKASGITISVSIQIIDSSFLDEDKGKNISLAFINEHYPFDDRIMYTIKFDKTRKQIISVIRDKKQFERSDINSQEDLPLPPRQ